MKKLILLSLLLLIPLASALSYTQNTNATIYLHCIDKEWNDCTNSFYCNITLFYPNGTIFVNNSNFTYHNLGNFSFTTPNLTTTGTYNGIYGCRKGSIYQDNYELMSSWFQFSVNQKKSSSPRGGGTINIITNPYICEMTYDFILDHIINLNLQYTQYDLDALKQEIDEIRGQPLDIKLLERYINNWDEKCSKMLNKTIIKPIIICKHVSNFLQNNEVYDDSDILDIKNNINKEVVLKDAQIIKEYLNNYNQKCVQPFNALQLKEEEPTFWEEYKLYILIGGSILFLIILFIIIFLLVLSKRQKRNKSE